MANADYQKLLHALVQGAELPPEDERALIETVAASNAKAVPSLCQMLAGHRRQLREELRAVRERCAKVEGELARAGEPPWYPADVVGVRADGRLEVVFAGRRLVLALASGVDIKDVRVGDEVLLGRDQNAVIARSDAPQRAGVVATVAEAARGRVLVTGVADEEIAAACAPDLAALLQAGDRVLFRRESQVVLERLGPRTDSPYVLERTPTTTFADIGGLDHVIADIRRDLDLHLCWPELVRKFRLRLIRGVTLIGPPGNAKTSIARAIAHHLAQRDANTRFLNVRPGALRGVFYGQTEKAIRELFGAARAHAGLVVMFFDELDSYGARGVGIGQDIDGRVMGTLLAEIDGLEPAGNVFCIGATNRIDLCDPGLVRPERLGGFVYTIPRPAREAARQIFGKYLTADLPYGPSADAAGLIEAAVSYLYASEGGAGVLFTVTLTSSERREVRAPAVMSGALISSAVESAKHVAAARRSAGGDEDITLEDVLGALDRALAAEVEKVRAPHAARRLLDFVGAEEIVRVDVPALRRPPRHRYLRAA